MALQISRSTTTKVRLISTLIAAFAFVVQPYAGLAFNQTAFAASVGDISITEAMPNPSSVDDDDGEYVIIKNTTGSVIGLEDWDIDGANLPSGTNVGAGDTLKICSGYPASSGCQVAHITGINLPQTGSGEELIQVHDENGVLVAQVGYEKSAVVAGTAVTFGAGDQLPITPAILSTSPAAGDTISGVTTLSATVTFETSDYKRVYFDIDGGTAGNSVDRNEVPSGSDQWVFDIPVDTTLYTNGTHELKVRLARTIPSFSVLDEKTFTFTIDNSTPAGPVKNVEDNLTFPTIQDAIDATTTGAGETILVSDGTYKENVKIDKSIILKSLNGRDATTIAPASGRAIDILSQNANLKNITIDGFTLTTGSTGGQIVLQANSDGNTDYDSRNLTYKNLIIKANGNTAVGLFDVTDSSIANVKIYDASTGFEMIGVYDTAIMSSNVEDSIQAVNIWSHPDYANNAWITLGGNTFARNDRNINVVDARQVHVTGGTAIWGGSNGVYFEDVYDSSIRGVQFYNQSSSSNLAVIELTGFSRDNVIKNNNFNDRASTKTQSTGGSAQAILIGDSSETGNIKRIEISNNNIYNVKGTRGGYALMVNRKTTNLKFHGNDINGVHGDAWAVAVALDARTSGAQITGNNFSDITGPAVAAVNVNHRTGNTASPASITIKHNNFNFADNSNIFGVNYDNIGQPAPATNVDASENWWNTDKGPGGSSGEADSDGAKIGQYVDYANWLCQPYTGLASVELSDDGSCIDVAASTVVYSDNYDGTGTLEFHVVNKDGSATEGLTAGDFTVHSSSGSNFAFTHSRFDFTDNGNGDYTVLYHPGVPVDRFWDVSIKGLLLEEDLHIVVTIDTTAPAVSNIKLNEQSVNAATRVNNCGPTDFNLVGTSAKLDATITDPSDVASARYRVVKVGSNGCVHSNPSVTYGDGEHGDKTGWFAMNDDNDDNVWTGPVFDTTTLAYDGYYTMILETKDENGNTVQKYIDLDVDNTGPSVSATVTNGEGLFDFYSPTGDHSRDAGYNPGLVKINGADNNGIASIKATIFSKTAGQSGWGAVDNTVIENDDEVELDTSKWSDGLYRVVIRVTDNAGNTPIGSNGNRVLEFVIDTKAPTLTINPVVDSTDTTPTVSGTTTDKDSKVYVNGHEATIDPTSNDDGTYNWTITLPEQALGSQTVTANSEDEAGNSAASATRMFVVLAPSPAFDPSAAGESLLSPIDTSEDTFSTVTNLVGRNGGIFGSVASAAAVTPSSQADNDGEVPAEILGAKDEQVPFETAAAITSSSQGWKLFGLAWYWWLLIVAAVAAFWWFLAAARRRRAEENA